MSPSRRRVAVVLFNLGGPDSLEAVRPFLYNLFRDPAIIDLPWPFRQMVARLISTTREKSAQANYAMMGGASPLAPETEAQARALEARFAAEPDLEVRAFLAMRYWKPFTEDAARAVADYAPDEVVLLPLYPQFSTTTSASSLKAWAAAYRGPARVRTVCCWPVLDGFLSTQADSIRALAAGAEGPLRVLFSAHGLPQKVVDAGDPYQWQVEQTCEAVGRRLGDGWDWQVCYQSRVGPLKWLGPSTPEALELAAREGKGVVVVPIAFVSEHVETLVELDHEYAELAQALKLPAYLRAPAVSVAEPFIDDLAALVRRALERPGGVETDGGGRVCPAQHGRCPAQAPIRALESA